VPDDALYRAAERRIDYFTVALGSAGSLGAGLIWGGRAAAGFAAGAVLAWLNFRWMKAGISGVAGLARAHQGAEKVLVPRGIYFRFIGRYALLILAAYAILKYFVLPVAGLLAGFGAVVVAVLAEAVGQLIRSKSIPRADTKG
jgi:ATP synthase I chain